MRYFTAVYVVSICILMTGCRDDQSIIDNVGEIQFGKVNFSLSDPPIQISKVVATLSRQGYSERVLTLSITDSDYSATGTFENVLIGRWHLRVDALDSANTLQFTGETDFEVISGQTTVVSLELLPANGTIEIHVRWGGACISVSSGLISWWPGDGNSNDIRDHNHGILHGDVTYVAGKVHNAFSFDGSNDYVYIPASSNLNVQSFTIEAWIFPRNPFPSDDYRSIPIVEYNDTTNQLTSLGVHFWHSQPVRFSGSGPGCLYANLWDINNENHTLASPANILTPDAWNHVALTYDRSTGTGRLYSNGKIAATSILGIFTPRTNIPLFVGYRPPSGPHLSGIFVGLIDELSIYARALFSSEIAAIFAAGAAGKCR